MKWFKFEAEGASLPWKEWGAVATDPEDMLAVISLGRRVDRACLKEVGLRAEEGAEKALTALAHVLHHTLEGMDEERWLELRWHLQEGWRQGEPWLWESPDRVFRAEASLGGQKELLPIVLALQHHLERVVRPELLRLLWCMLTSAGRRTPLQALEARDAQEGMLFPQMLLEQLAVDRVPPFLDEEELGGMVYLRSLLRLSERVSTDELLEALVLRRYRLQGSKLFLEPYLRGGGEWCDRAEVMRWREHCLRCCALLFAFRTMFMASVSGESGPLRVSFPD